MGCIIISTRGVVDKSSLGFFGELCVVAELLGVCWHGGGKSFKGDGLVKNFVSIT